VFVFTVIPRNTCLFLLCSINNSP